jgi:hypothetical protein
MESCLGDHWVEMTVNPTADSWAFQMDTLTVAMLGKPTARKKAA